MHTASSSSSDEEENKKKPSLCTDDPNRELQDQKLEDFVNIKLKEFSCKTDTSTISHTRSPVMTADHTNVGKRSTNKTNNTKVKTDGQSIKLEATNSTLRLSTLSSTKKLKFTTNNTHESSIKTKVTPKNAIIVNPSDVDKHITKQNSKLRNEIGTEDNTKKKDQLLKRFNSSSSLCTPTPPKKLKLTTENNAHESKIFHRQRNIGKSDTS